MAGPRVVCDDAPLVAIAVGNTLDAFHSTFISFSKHEMITHNEGSELPAKLTIDR